MLALFPLHTVLFPGGRLPLRIFETRYVDLVRDCMKRGTGFGVVAIRDGQEAGAPAVPYGLGTLAEIVDWDRGPDGLLHIVARGTTRFRVNATRTRPNGLLEAEVDWLDDLPPPHALPGGFMHLSDLLNKLLEGDHGASDWRDDALGLVYRLAERVPLELGARVALLETRPVAAHLGELDRLLRLLVAKIHPDQGRRG